MAVLFRIFTDTTHCHLWMFLFDILMKESKSHVAVWEDQKGMFRIKAPAKLAEMWGEKRNRTNMTYEKLSRSLRHYYEKKILRKVPKRKYTYKFNSKEILKSYEVQPFYRRNSTGQSQRQSKITPPSSGQSSPYAPITPSPSYMDSNKHFQWPQPPQYTQQSAWPTKQEATAVSDNQQMMANAYQQPQPQQMVTPQQDNSMLWSNQNQEQFTYGQVPQPSVQHQMSQTPTLPTDITNSMYVESSVYSTGMLLEAPTYTCAYTGGPNRKPAVQHRIAQPDGVINNLKMQPAAPLTLHIPPMCDQMSRQKSYTDYSLASSYCRSDSYSSHTSCDNNTSLDSFLESDKIFNDIMESLAMEVF